MPTRDLPGQTSSNYWAKESQGLQVFANTFFRCPIPVGPEYVELTDSAPHTIERIFFDYEFTGLTFNFWVNLVIISPTSNDFCECDQFDGLDVPDTFYQKQLVWDGIGNNCQGCADSNWVPMIGSAWSDRGIPVFWEVKRIMVAADG